MTKFNLNDYVLIQITEYGWTELKKKYSPDYIKHCILNKLEIIEDESWYKIPAHEVITTFGNMLFWTHPHPINSNILVP